MSKVPAPVLWNQENAFLNSALYNVDILSVVVDTVQKPVHPFPPAATPTLQSTLQIKEPDFGTLYLNMTLAGWQALIRAASASSGITPLLKVYNITEESNSITDDTLVGAVLLAVWKNGLDLDPTGMLVEENGGAKIEFPEGQYPQDGDTVGVIYYIE